MSERRIEQGMRAELALRRRVLDGGAEPIGWKVAFDIPAVQELLALSLNAMLAGNLFHRAVVFAPRVEADAPGPARFVVNGELRAEVDADGAGAHLGSMVEVIAGRLSDAGEQLRPGDRIITGVIAPPTPVVDGNCVRLELEGLGAVELTFGALQ